MKMNVILGNVLLTISLMSFVFLFLGTYIYFKKAYNMLVRRIIKISPQYYIQLMDNIEIVGVLKSKSGKKIDEILELESGVIYRYLIGSRNLYRINEINSDIFIMKNINQFPQKIKDRINSKREEGLS